jgi:hypothetical protein
MTATPKRPGGALLLSALLASCATSTAGPDAARPAPLPTTDAAGLSRWVEHLCADLYTRAACREAALVRVAEERGIASAMEVVAGLEMSDSEGHIVTHMIGIQGYRGAERVGESFAECTPIHQSGCYHGVIQAYFGELRGAAEGATLTPGLLDGLCAAYREAEDDQWLRFQCLHGLGHGVMLVRDHHLPGALEACDLLSSGWEREVCYGGAFMESVITATRPHHGHVGAAVAAHAEHPHHEHGHDGHATPTAAVEPFPALNPEDLHHPCSALPERYGFACYGMQTAVMLHLLDGDIAATAAACRQAPDPILRSVCHRSLGRDINAITHGRHGRSAALCALAADADRPACHAGVVKNVIDVTADAGSGVSYCRLAPPGPERQACFRAIGEQTAILLPRPEDRARLCQTLDGPDRAGCLEGAGREAQSWSAGAAAPRP